MSRWMLAALAAIGLALPAAAPHAGTLTYSGYSVLNNQTVVASDSALGVNNESAGSGQITLLNTNTPGGSLATWCIDIKDWLQSSGTFSTGTYLTGTFANQVNALLTHVLPTLASNYNASSALQVAIWKAEYGSGLNLTAPTAVLQLADTFLSNVTSGQWKADTSMQVAVLAGGGHNQDQAYLTAVDEPGSLAVLGAGLIGVGLITRRGRLNQTS